MRTSYMHAHQMHTQVAGTYRILAIARGGAPVRGQEFLVAPGQSDRLVFVVSPIEIVRAGEPLSPTALIEVSTPIQR